MLVGQALVATVPLSPLHATQAFAPEHTGVTPEQFAEVLQVAHSPALGPTVTQIGWATAKQGRVDTLPKLPLHAAHTSLVGVVLQVGVVPVHAATRAGVQVPHVFFAVSQIGSAAGQSASTTHPPH